MRDTLHRIGLSESDLVRHCDAAFKQGSKFCRWRTDDASDGYYHPFMAPLGWGEFDASALWQEQHSSSPYAEFVSAQPHICSNLLAPKQAETPEYAAVANYAYHLDAGKFGELLGKHCRENLGVHHILDHVEQVIPGENDHIKAVATRDHGEVHGDLFIDCTGFKALLIGEHLHVPFVDRGHQLFNDSALAIQVPHATNDAPIASATLSTAHAAGWIWDIALPSRRGIGVVYSSGYTDAEAARETLTAYLQSDKRLGNIDESNARNITFKPGHRERFWSGNCVAVGVSAGFIEPLEASALALIELSATMISDEMPANHETMSVVARRFNERFRYRWERIMEFLKLHYVLSERTEPYWQDHRKPSTIPQRLSENLRLWRHKPPSRNDFHHIEEIFPAASYHYVLHGMGFAHEQHSTRKRPDHRTYAKLLDQHQRYTRKLLAGLPDHRELVGHIIEHGMPKHSPGAPDHR